MTVSPVKRLGVWRTLSDASRCHVGVLAQNQQAELENELLRRWANDLAYLSVDSEALTEADLPMMMQCKKSLVWYRNTDLSVNGHISDAEQWVRQALHDHGLERLSDNDAFGLGDHINKMRKRAKKDLPGNTSFVPVARMLDDGLYRFANGLTNDLYPNTQPGNFPNPYDLIPGLQAKTPMPEALPDNVVCLATFRNKKG